MRTGSEMPWFILGSVLLVTAFLSILFLGAVDIPVRDVSASLFGGPVSNQYFKIIILETRLPMAIGAACCGSMLSVSGLMMQTVFQNPLAGPSVLGVTSGASLGVALFLLGVSGLGSILSPALQPVFSIIGALIGGMTVILILLLFSSVLKTAVTLLIVGIMIGYLCSSGISLLNYFSPADEMRNYLVWGLGSFTGLRLNSAFWLVILCILSIIPSLFYIKPLNAMLIGERFLESVGYSVKQVRATVLCIAGLLVAIPTAFCGPIGFIGLIVPHLCRILFRSSNHLILLPACMLFGALVSLMCALIGVVPSASYGVLPVNVITPLFGVPMILYILVKRNKLPYFS